MKNPKKYLKIVVWLVFGAALLGIAYVALIYFLLFQSPWNNRNFDSQLWISYQKSEDYDNPRGEMIDSLLSEYLEIGMRKADILKLLGTPDYEDETNVLSYRLGAWSGFGIDIDTLNLHMDDSDCLKSHEVVQH